jgi:hypothetical protein
MYSNPSQAVRGLPCIPPNATHTTLRVFNTFQIAVCRMTIEESSFLAACLLYAAAAAATATALTRLVSVLLD